MTIQTPITAPHGDIEARVFRAGRFGPDDWVRVGDDEPVPAGRRALLSVRRFLAETEAGTLANRDVGVVLEPADRVADIVPHLGRLSVVAVDFPKFSDGRGFSHAALLARHGFRGELRAVGNVLIDQFDAMRRLGFNAFEVTHAVTRRYLSEGRNPAPRHYYQPSVIPEPPAGTRPWLRRAEDR